MAGVVFTDHITWIQFRADCDLLWSFGEQVLYLRAEWLVSRHHMIQLNKPLFILNLWAYPQP